MFILEQSGSYAVICSFVKPEVGAKHLKVMPDCPRQSSCLYREAMIWWQADNFSLYPGNSIVPW